MDRNIGINYIGWRDDRRRNSRWRMEFETKLGKLVEGGGGGEEKRTEERLGITKMIRFAGIVARWSEQNRKWQTVTRFRPVHGLRIIRLFGVGPLPPLISRPNNRDRFMQIPTIAPPPPSPSSCSCSSSAATVPFAACRGSISLAPPFSSRPEFPFVSSPPPSPPPSLARAREREREKKPRPG